MDFAAQSSFNVRPAGDSCLMVVFGDQPAVATSNAVLAYEEAVRRRHVPGVIETFPTICSVAVRFDPLDIDVERLRCILEDLFHSRDWRAAGSPARRLRLVLPTVFGGADGPDLAELADLLGLSESRAVAEFAATPQRVLMLGFSPGQPYLGMLGERWNLPRLEKVKQPVAAGSVNVAIRQTVLLAARSSTGWRTIGQSTYKGLIDRDAGKFQLSPGDEVVFEPVTQAEFGRLSSRRESGRAAELVELAS